MAINSKLNTAVRLALGLSAGAVAFNANYAFAQDEDQAEAVEEVVVTGSRIKRSTNTQSSEIITISAADMEITGDQSVAEALRSSNLNALGSFRESSGSSAQSNATVDLRGVGAARTLVLINGRRTVGSPSLGGGGTVNLNMIPFSAVERIELIADGASAVYGSDAVAGVVNVILKKGYEGLTITARYGDRSQDEGNISGVSLLTGASNDRGSVTFGLEYDQRDPIFDADRDYTAARYGDYNGDGIIQGYEETVGVSIYGYTLINPAYNGNPYDPNDTDTWYYHPGANCTESGGFAGPMEYFGFGQYCGYQFALVSANRAGIKRLNTWVSAEYELTDNIDMFVDAVISNNESFGRYAPPAAPGPVIPGDPRNNIGATYGYFRWTDIGFRDNVVDDRLVDINAGFRGELSDNLSWEAYATFSEYKSASVGQYYLSYAGLAYNVAYGVSDFDQFVANLKTTTLNDDRSQLAKGFLGLQWDMFEMAGGTASSYFAAEYFEVDYAALVDAQSEAGLVGGSAGNSAEGYRDVTAFAAEVILPVTDWLEIDAAVRYDDYSDFGSATSPKIGALAHIPGFSELKFKATWGKGFRAPDLSDLYGATSFSAEGATDYWGCQLANGNTNNCPSQQFSTYIGSNPNLDAETSETFSVGAEWEFIDSWVASVNYFNLKITDSIEYTSAQDQLDVDFQTQGGNPNVQRNGNIVARIDAGYQNGVTEFTRDAMDFSLRGMFDTGVGSFAVSANATYYISYDVEESYGTGDLVDAAGTLGFPEWRANAYVNWSMNNIFANLAWDYIGESESNVSDAQYDDWMVWNASVGYDFNDFGTVTLGVNNLLDEDPLLDDFGTQVDEYMYDNTGRVIYVNYRIEF